MQHNRHFSICGIAFRLLDCRIQSERFDSFHFNVQARHCHDVFAFGAVVLLPAASRQPEHFSQCPCRFPLAAFAFFAGMFTGQTVLPWLPSRLPVRAGVWVCRSP